MLHKSFLLILILFILLSYPAIYCFSENNNILTVTGYNVNSGGSDSKVVSQRISELHSNLLGLSEVSNENYEKTFKEAAGKGENTTFESILGTTEGSDKLLILYNPQILELKYTQELTIVDNLANQRLPLMACFVHKQTNIKFLFIENHFARKNSNFRYEQARSLNRWAQSQSLPIIATGDYNFDWDVNNGDNNHDEGYDLLCAGNIFIWVRPDILVKSQGNPRYNSVLDFIFVANGAKNWNGKAQIMEKDGDFSDGGSDHRPVCGRFYLN